ncbi:MAG: HNH endonuclease [Anaerolineales bacterium]|nr:HNH endonuclease [Anaerolineales bacterium]
MSKELIQELRDTFEYHADGYLIRKKNGKPCGQRANDPNGYARVSVGRHINKRQLYVHRIIYAIVHGEMPEGQIDHIDQNRINNRIENLREVSSSENLHNSKKRKDNSSGFPGVYWDAHARKWKSQIMVNNRNIHLGLYKEFADAVLAKKKAKIKYHPSSPEAIKYASEYSNIQSLLQNEGDYSWL